MNFVLTYEAPPTPSPGETVVSPSVTTTTTGVPMTQLPTTGPARTESAWGALALGLVVLTFGVIAIVTAKVRRNREA